MADLGSSVEDARIGEALSTLQQTPGWGWTVRRLRPDGLEAPPVSLVEYSRGFYQRRYLNDCLPADADLPLGMIRLASRLDRVATVVRRWSPLRAAWVGAVVKGVWFRSAADGR